MGCVYCANITTCSDCNETLNYVLSSPTCLLCQANLNYFADASTQTCVLCSLSNCINCSSLTQCRECNSAAAYYVGGGGTCQYCDPATNQFINPVTKGCVGCPIANCTTCSSFSACQTCNSGFVIDTNDYLCYVCTLVGC